MELPAFSNNLTSLIAKPFGFIFYACYLFIFAVAKICNLLFFPSKPPMPEIDSMCLNSFIINIPTIILITIVALFHISNHIIITFDILFFLSLAILVLFHFLKNP